MTSLYHQKTKMAIIIANEVIVILLYDRFNSYVVLIIKIIPITIYMMIKISFDFNNYFETNKQHLILTPQKKLSS
jgi:hypothetical protein